jgi:NAD(P)H-flavin reductase
VKPTNNHSTTAHREEHLLAPYWAEIKEIVPEAEGVSTYWLEFTDKEIREKYQFACGQFNMLYLPGYGEAAISISSDPEKPELIGHTVRFVGNVTQAISRLNVGETLGIRGPFGTTWQIDELQGQDVVIAAGGIGLAPLRPVIYHIINHRDDYGRVVIIYGARSPRDLLYPQEYATWEENGIEVMPTVDRADESWQGHVGVVPMLFYHLRFNNEKTILLSCGPEIMMRFVVFEGLARRIPTDRIYLSLERNMKCGQGFCGHCQMGPFFVCKDGPVFRFDQLEPYFNLEDL